MMAKERAQRYQTPEELVEAIERIFAGEESSGRRAATRPSISNTRLPAISSTRNPSISNTRNPAISNSRTPALRKGALENRRELLLPVAASAVGLLVLGVAGCLLLKGEDPPPKKTTPEKTGVAAKSEPKTEAKTTSGVAQESKSDVIEKPPPREKPAGRIALKFDFDEAQLPSGWVEGVRVTSPTAGNSPGALRAGQLVNNTYFNCIAEYRLSDHRPFVTITDRTYVSMDYYATSPKAFKIQMNAVNVGEHYNIGYSVSDIQTTRWNTIKVRACDAFRTQKDGGGGVLIKPGINIRNLQFFSGAPNDGTLLYIDNVIFPEE